MTESHPATSMASTYPESSAWTLTAWGAEVTPLWPSDVILEFVQRAGVDLPVRIMEIVFCSDLRRLNLRVLPKRPPNEHKWVVFSPEGARLILSPSKELVGIMRHWTKRFFAEAIEPLPDTVMSEVKRLSRWNRITELCIDDTEYYLEPDEVDERDVFWATQLEQWVQLLDQYNGLIDRVWQLFGIPSIPIGSGSAPATTLTRLHPWCLDYLQHSFQQQRHLARPCFPSAATLATAASATSTSSLCEDEKNK